MQRNVNEIFKVSKDKSEFELKIIINLVLLLLKIK